VNFHEKERKKERSFFWTKFPTIPVNFSNKKVRYEFLPKQKCIVDRRRVKIVQQIPSIIYSSLFLSLTTLHLVVQTPKQYISGAILTSIHGAGRTMKVFPFTESNNAHELCILRRTRLDVFFI
jgi:hypothetical protein